MDIGPYRTAFAASFRGLTKRTLVVAFGATNSGKTVLCNQLENEGWGVYRTSKMVESGMRVLHAKAGGAGKMENPDAPKELTVILRAGVEEAMAAWRRFDGGHGIVLEGFPRNSMQMNMITDYVWERFVVGVHVRAPLEEIKLRAEMEQDPYRRDIEMARATQENIDLYGTVEEHLIRLGVEMWRYDWIPDTGPDEDYYIGQRGEYLYYRVS